MATSEVNLEGGSYEVIRTRLLGQVDALAQAAQALNQKRRDEFGGDELAVAGNDRVRTEHSCVARDIAQLGPRLLLGFNVFMGLKQERSPRDVFSLHQFVRQPDGTYNFDELKPSEAGGFLEDRRFTKDFGELTRYYKDSKLLRLWRTDGRLLAVMQTGQALRDVKVFRFAVDAEGRATYLDMNGEPELPKLPTHDFEWTRLGREHVVQGRHPHVNVFDEIFVETTGGDLTVKVENNTETGQGIFSEPVEEKDQSLDDAEFHVARVGGLILLKVRPFREDAYRYLVYNPNAREVTRVDGVGLSCVQLPEDQGVAFPGGYALRTGEVKTFDGDWSELAFERVLKSPNGEDVLYVFFGLRSGRYLLLPYNLVRKEMASPLPCHGWALFPDGQLVIFRASGDEPTRVHPVQVWRTPFVAPEVHAARPPRATALGRIGNADLVRGISDVLTLHRLARAPKPTRRTWEELVASAQRALDAYFWLGEPSVALAEQVRAVKASAELILDEFEKVLALEKRARDGMADAEAQVGQLLARTAPGVLANTQEFMGALQALRAQRGKLISLKEVRYVDVARLDALEAQLVEQAAAVGQACVQFLLTPTAFDPVKAELARAQSQVDALARTAELEPVVKQLEETAQGLDLLGEAVAGLKAGDADQKAQILERLSEVYAQLNRTRGGALAKRKELLTKDRRAEFGAQFKLLGQALESALALADSPERCDEQLARLSVQLEELEGRFAELDEFAAPLAERREALFEAFESKKRTLVDERQRRALNLFQAAERILQGVQRRAKAFTSEDELNGFFAGDPMLEKLRDLGQQLLGLKDSVRADELDSKLKAAKQDALRGLRDKKDLFEDGQNVIKLGEHKFNVNTQPVELTVLPKDGALCLHVTGTDFLQPLTDPQLAQHQAVWERTLPSEAPHVYRGETLAATLLFRAEAGEGGLSLAALRDAVRGADGGLALVRQAAQDRFDEGYERGVHDADAALILGEVLKAYELAGLLRYPGTPRAWATLAWGLLTDAQEKPALLRQARSFARLKDTFATSPAFAAVAQAWAERLARQLVAQGLAPTAGDAALAARYLLDELAAEDGRFVVSRDAVALRDALFARLEREGGPGALVDDLAALAALKDRWQLARAWLEALVRAPSAPEGVRALSHAVDEAAALLLVRDELLPRRESQVPAQGKVTGLLGQHPRVVERSLPLRIDEFVSRLAAFVRDEVPAFHAFRAQVRALLDEQKSKLRLDELVPKVLSSFVRNQLIDTVYLPLIGKNLAKQLGAAGEGKRTDRMGMLLLVSPPGYGKTTLMEYVASRLGLVFVKVNGPALGHEVVSLDPADAPNATARQEVERINFAFELGNNVMLYLDDIQHTNAELLQKFISLCDGQRRVEGVWAGKTRTYDLRGKKFCVVMAGNPYTESGETFKIPDMLANRADTYNLGDILDGKQQVFAQSYLENALTANPVLAPLAGRARGDVLKLFAMARGEPVASTDLEHPYSGVELQELVAVLQRLMRVQATLLLVNQQYIASAAQDDRYRTEPPFKLQGSYRNMGKLAEKVVAGMTDDEVERLVDGHYAQESQTLTTAAEQNLLKLAELRGRLTEAQAQRWAELKRGFQRVQLMGGGEDDPVARVTGSIATLGARLETIGTAVEKASARPPAPPPSLDGVTQGLAGLAAALERHLAAPARGGGVGVGELAPVLASLERALAHRPQPTASTDPALVEAVRAVAHALVEAGRKPMAYDGALVEAVEGLAQVARQALEQPRPAALDVSGLERALKDVAVASGPRRGKPAAALPADAQVRLTTLHDALTALERSTRQALQQGAAGELKVAQVWQELNEALLLVKALRQG